MKLDMNYYKSLPYDIDAVVLEEEIDKLLGHYEKNRVNIDIEMNLMCELTAKQYLICETVNSQIKNRIEKWLYKCITHNFDYPLDVCFCIAERFALKKVLCFLEDKVLVDLINKHNTAKYYRSLPDNLSEDYLAVEFKRLLNIVKEEKYSLLDILDSLSELSYRQLNRYEEIDENLKQEFGEWLIQVLDFNSLEVVEFASNITLILQLKKVFAFIKSRISILEDKAIKDEIQEMIKEFELKF